MKMRIIGITVGLLGLCVLLFTLNPERPAPDGSMPLEATRPNERSTQGMAAQPAIAKADAERKVHSANAESSPDPSEAVEDDAANEAPAGDVAHAPATQAQQDQEFDGGDEPASDRPVVTGRAAGKQSAPAIAVRLADDFQLPAAVMHEAAANSVESSKSPVRETNRRMIGKFYSDLAAVAAEEMARTGTEASSESTPGSDTAATPEASGQEYVAQPGSPGEALRRRHDDQFRALNGKASYNRRTLEAAIERTLPPLPESAVAE